MKSPIDDLQDPEQKQNKLVETSKVLFERFTKDYEFGYQGTSRSSHKLLWISFIFIVLALIWSYFATLDEVTVALGKVIPSKQMQVIQNLEGGIVKDILVHPGEIVEKDEIIAYLDNTRFASEYNAAIHKAAALQITILRLNAQMNETPLVIPPELAKLAPDLTASEKMLYDTQLNQIKGLEQRRELVEREIGMTQPLVKQGDVSKVEVIHLQQNLSEINNQILTFKSTALDGLTKAKGDYDSLQSDLTGLKDRFTRTVIRSPVRGIINEIYVTTIGGVIKPGDNFMDIVPLDDSLLVEAKVRPSDIGFIHPGQDATVKITAYDYSIYGGLPGTVEHISADTIKDEKNEQYYEIRVRTKQNYIQSKERKLFIMPGMTASVDILTGHKSVLDYILKPILKAKQSALRER